MCNLSIYLTPQDLEWAGWPEALGSVFSTLVLHGSADQLCQWMTTEKAKALLPRAGRGTAGIL